MHINQCHAVRIKAYALNFCQGAYHLAELVDKISKFANGTR